MVSANKAHVWVCKGTGISHDHVKYLAGDGAAKAFFTSKSVMDFDTSTIRAASLYSKNVQKTHLPTSLDGVKDCDFFCYENETENIFQVCKIETLEAVNENTTRIYWVPDFYHTWIEKVKFGYCLVERRHFTDMSDPLLSLTREPIDVPILQSVFEMKNLNQSLSALWLKSKIYAFMTSDQYNNSNNPQVQFNVLGGVPFWGLAKSFDSVGEVTDFLRQYIDNQGVAQSSQLPQLSNIQRIVLVPSPLMEPSATGYTEEGKDNISIFKSKFGKIYSPQYFRGQIVSVGSGSTADFDLTRFTFESDGSISFNYVIEGCGGTRPKLRLSLKQDGDVEGKASEIDCSVIDLTDFTEIPVNAYLPERPTTYGVITSLLSGAISGASSFGAVGASLGPQGAALGAVAGTGIGAEIALQKALNPPAVNYVKAGATPEMAQAQSLISVKAVLSIPSVDGLEILEDFFNSYGYTVMKREKLRLDYGSNFTYIKLAEPPTQITPNIPHYAFRDIGERLVGGLTIWKAEIGSVKEYN